MNGRLTHNGRHRYQVGEFQLDTDQAVILRDGISTQLTPKAYGVLWSLVQSAGRIVSKDELLKTVWPDSFVEEGNLAVAIRQLRRIFGDDAHSPSYIETVPRRGYRLVAQVREIAEDTEAPGTELSHPAIASPDDRPRIGPASVSRPILLAIIGVIVLFTVSSGALYFWRESSRPVAQRLRNLRVERLSETGNIQGAGISPDGKLLAYSTLEGGKSVIWLRQLATGTSMQISPPLDEVLSGVSFSNDGQHIYYYHSVGGGFSDMSKISILGGGRTKILSSVHTGGGFSPDGGQIAFVRYNDGVSSIVIADENGGNEQALLSTPKGRSIVAVDWSPDGSSIAYSVGKFPSRDRDFEIVEYEIGTGTERPVTEFRWSFLSSVKWLPDRSGLIASGRDTADGSDQIWLVALPEGETRQISFDSSSLRLRGSTADGSTIAASSRYMSSKLWVGSSAEPDGVKPFAPAQSDLAFLKDGSIVFPALDTVTADLWIVNADGTGRRQLTNNDAVERCPVVSPDGRFIVYVANLNGRQNIWRVDLDGRDPVRLTDGDGEQFPTITPDGRFVLYNSLSDGSVMKIPIEGGRPTRLFEGRALRVSLSPDGEKAAYIGLKEKTRTLYIRSVADGSILYEFPIDGRQVSPSRVLWSDDGQAVIYIVADHAKAGNLVRHPLNGSVPIKITNFTTEDILDFGYSPDGKQVALVRGVWKHDVVLLTGAD